MKQGKEGYKADGGEQPTSQLGLEGGCGLYRRRRKPIGSTVTISAI
jgi:hypothetical protein